MNRLVYILCLMLPAFVHAKTTSVHLVGQAACVVELSPEIAQKYSPVIVAQIVQGEFFLDCTEFSEEKLKNLSTFLDLVEKQETSTWHGIDFLMQHGSSLLGIAHHLGLKDLLVQKLMWGQAAISKLIT